MRYPVHPLFVLACLLATAPAASAASGPELLPDNGEARFQALDADQDGRVSWDEFHRLNTSITRQGFDTIDSDKNGFLSLDEWKSFTLAHGMGVAMPSTSSSLPAREAVPPRMPLVMPPAGAPAPGEPASPSPAMAPHPLPPDGKPVPPPPAAGAPHPVPSDGKPVPPSLEGPEAGVSSPSAPVPPKEDGNPVRIEERP